MLHVVPLLLFGAPASALIAGGGAPADGAGTLRAWDLLRQYNAGPMLVGLPEALEKASRAPRSDPVWTGAAGGGRLRLHLSAEEGVKGPILAGFFGDARWSSAPVQVREFPGPGRYLVEGLPEGAYQVGASAGQAADSEALGVHRSWPRPVRIRQVGDAEPEEVEVLLSHEFQRARDFYQPRQRRVSSVKDTRADPGAQIRGRVTGPAGAPIPWAAVSAQEHRPGADRWDMADTSTGEDGDYRLGEVKWPCRLIFYRRQWEPDTFAWRELAVSLAPVFQAGQVVDFQFKEGFPEGRAVLKGRAVDQEGSPIREFRVWVTSKQPDSSVEAWKRGEAEMRSTSLMVPFLADDGAFRLGGLVSGEFSVAAIPFQEEAFEIDGRWLEVQIRDGRETAVELRVRAKKALWARIVLEGSSHPEPPLRLLLGAAGPGRAKEIGRTDAEGYARLHLGERELQDLERGRATINIVAPSGSTLGVLPVGRLSKAKQDAEPWRVRAGPALPGDALRPGLAPPDPGRRPGPQPNPWRPGGRGRPPKGTGR